MSFQQFMAILGNEGNRRLSNIQEGVVSHEEVKEILEQFIREIKNSGYNCKEAREIIMSSIRGWRRRGEKRKREGRGFYRQLKLQQREEEAG